MSENFVINIKHKALILKSFMYTWSKNLFLSYACIYGFVLALSILMSFITYSIDPFIVIINMSIFGSETDANRVCRLLFAVCFIVTFIASFENKSNKRQPYFCD